MTIETNKTVLLLCASILGAALIMAYLPRYEATPMPQKLGIYFHDKWTGEITICGQEGGDPTCYEFTNRNAPLSDIPQ